MFQNMISYTKTKMIVHFDTMNITKFCFFSNIPVFLNQVKKLIFKK